MTWTVYSGNISLISNAKPAALSTKVCLGPGASVVSLARGPLVGKLRRVLTANALIGQAFPITPVHYPR